MAPQTTLIAHLAFSYCAYKTTCSHTISSHGVVCESLVVLEFYLSSSRSFIVVDIIYKRHAEENVLWYQSI